MVVVPVMLMCRVFGALVVRLMVAAEATAMRRLSNKTITGEYATTSTTFAAVARRMQVSPAAVTIFAPVCVTRDALLVNVKADANRTK